MKKLSKLGLNLWVIVLIVFSITGCGGGKSSSGLTTLLSENFESYSAGAWTPAGAGWTPLPDRGTWTIANDGSKVLQYVASDEGSSFIYKGDSTWSNITIQARVKMGNGSVFTSIARVKGGANYHQLALTSTGSMFIYYAHAGATQYSPSIDVGTINMDQFYTLKMVFNGNNIKGYLDGVLKVDFTDTAMDSNNNSGYAAVFCDDDRSTAGRHGTFDDILVTTP